MDTYVTGATIKTLRESRKMTQAVLAEKIGVSAKTVSKWETGRGLPDISMLEPLAQALGVSVVELMQGQPICNQNRSANMLRSKFYVCPVCGNIFHGMGDALVGCCGLTLPPLEAEEPEAEHNLVLEKMEDGYYLTIHHPMTKGHFISFVAHVSSDRLQLIKLYPEGEAATRLHLDGGGWLYYCCNRHGLFRRKL